MTSKSAPAYHVVGRGLGLAHLKKISASNVRQARVEVPSNGGDDKSSYPILSNEVKESVEPKADETVFQDGFEKDQCESQDATSKPVTVIDLTGENNPGEPKPTGDYSEENIITLAELKDVEPIWKEPVSNTNFDPVLLKSVNCQEFVPDPVLLKSVNCEEFVPRQRVYKTDVVDDPDTSVYQMEEFEPPPRSPLLRVPSQGDDDEYFILDLIKNTVYNLTESPGDYDYIIGDFTDNLLEIKSKSTMDEFVTILIEQAIAEPNFLYSAARMCHAYDEKKTLEISKDISFRGCLYPRLQREFNSINELLKEPTDSESFKKALGLSLLFAELLVNMKKGAELNVVFVKAIFKIIEILLEDAREKTINCLIKILKLTGPTLDKHKIKESIAQVDETFNKIRDLALDGRWLENLESGQSLRTRMFSVYKLHLRNWDADMNEEKPDSSFSSPDNDKSDSTIDWNEYYVGDEEESDFGDIDDAYEQFLKESGQL